MSNPMHGRSEALHATYDLVLRGGRVIDPESGLDAIRDLGLTGGVISAISSERLRGGTVLDVAGLAVCPGFIDLHSHAQEIPELRLQALDGVTTALELEAGASPVDTAYRRAAEEGRPINYGFSASWASARLAELAGVEPDALLATTLSNFNNPAWQRPAAPDQVAAIVDRLAVDLAAGGIGIGILVGYAPLVEPSEYVAVASLAQEMGRPTFTHARELVESNPNTPIDGPSEIIRAAAETGAHMHYCHINSTTRRHIDRVHTLIEDAQRGGARVTTEAYPYGSGATGIGAAFLAPELLPRLGITPRSIVYVTTGERVADADRLSQLRKTDPGGFAIVELLDENDPSDWDVLRRTLLFEDTVIASDATPLTWTAGPTPDPMVWPLPEGAVTHPRTAGTHARALRLLVREWSAVPLSEAIRRCSLLPAQVLERSVPTMLRKGRIQVGCDADIVVFDPETVTDRATYADSVRPSTGFRHVLVGGESVVRDGVIVLDALPGRPVRAAQFDSGDQISLHRGNGDRGSSNENENGETDAS